MFEDNFDLSSLKVKTENFLTFLSSLLGRDKDGKLKKNLVAKLQNLLRA